MNSRIKLPVVILVLFAAAPASAVQFGWQSLPDGGIEYLVQIEPDLLDSFRQEGFSSDIPASLQRDLRRIYITVGNKPLPNQGDIRGPKSISPETAPNQTAPTNAAPGSAQQMAPKKSSGLTTAPPLPTPATQRPRESQGSTFSDLILPPPPTQQLPKAESPSASAPRPLSSLPFFQSGQITKIDRGNSPIDAQTSTPRLNNNDVSSDDRRPFMSDHLAMAAKPAVYDTPLGSGHAPVNSAAAAKPWLPLMTAMLALFASLGANVYLAWMHQSLRLKYQTLLQRMPGDSAAAILKQR